MSAAAFLLAFSAAFLHAGWNLLLARTRDVEAATAVMLFVAAVAFAPAAAATWRFEREAIPYLAASGVLELVYFALLAVAYQRADLSLVYPISRGLAPVLVLVVGLAALGADVTPAGAAGVCFVGLGVLLVRGGLHSSSDRSGLSFGLAIAVTIAAYTLVDDRGIEHAAPFVYLELSLLLPAIVYPAVLGARRGVRTLAAEARPAVAIAGLAAFGSYGLVLAALARAPAAPVAAVRETSIVIATGLAALILRERVTRARFLGATIVVAGVALLTL